MGLGSGVGVGVGARVGRAAQDTHLLHVHVLGGEEDVTTHEDQAGLGMAHHLQGGRVVVGAGVGEGVASVFRVSARARAGARVGGEG